jgi:hypothetical protein
MAPDSAGIGPISGERDVDLISGGLVNDQKISHVRAAQLIVGIQQFNTINGAFRIRVDDHFFADIDRLDVTGFGPKAEVEDIFLVHIKLMLCVLCVSSAAGGAFNLLGYTSCRKINIFSPQRRRGRREIVLTV